MIKKVLNIVILTSTIGLLLFSLAASVANAGWVVQVNGAVDEPFSFTLSDFAAMPQTSVGASLLCDGAYVSGGAWTGVRLSYLLEQAGYHQNASSIVFHAQDGYASNLPITAIQNNNVIVANALDGKPLAETLRLVVPNVNGEFWIAYLTSITVSTAPYSPPNQDMNPPPAATTPPATTTPKPTPTMPTPPPPSQNKTSTQATTPSADSQSLQQTTVTSSSNVPAEYAYPIIFAAIALTTTAIGGIAYDYRRKTNKNADSDGQLTQA
jgi:DMSO/TMAO reductase YedYZ molybdopterin-dependent catalytic subunit